MTTRQQAQIEWRDGPDAGTVPVSTRFDDPYFSLQGGLDETRHVFLAGNDLPARFRDGFQIAELGFGTGLNLLTALLSWRATNQPGRLHFTSFEAFPMAPADMARALTAFPVLDDVKTPLLSAWAAGQTRIQTDDLTAEVILGDARETLPRWQGRADAWFLDGFSPAQNPELWQPDLLAEVARHTAPQGTFATYTAAGFVRRALQGAGFAVERRAGFGRKRHMSVGTLAA